MTMHLKKLGNDSYLNFIINSFEAESTDIFKKKIVYLICKKFGLFVCSFFFFFCFVLILLAKH